MVEMKKIVLKKHENSNRLPDYQITKLLITCS
jgi:hypothetical protein